MCEETRQHGSGGGRRKRTRTTGTSPAAYLTLNTHVCAQMRQFIDDHAWLTVYQLPAYSPDLNPTEGIWSLLRRALANIAFADLADLEQAIRQRLRTIQHRPHLIEGCVTGTGLSINAEPP